MGRCRVLQWRSDRSHGRRMGKVSVSLPRGLALLLLCALLSPIVRQIRIGTTPQDLAAPNATGCQAAAAGASDAQLRKCRYDAVRQAVAHAWRGYVLYGWGYDDVSPMLGSGIENWHARSTIFDSLDTLWLAGMHDEFESVMSELHRSGPPLALLKPTKLFEYSIRIIGGLLGAYTVSKKPSLLDAAVTAADSLIDCARQWDEPLPMPTGRLSERRQPLRHFFARVLDRITRQVTHQQVGFASLAGAGTFSLEMRYLSRETGTILPPR